MSAPVTWNHFQFGGEICRDPASGKLYRRLTILDRLHGRSRSGEISDAELDALISGLEMVRNQSLAANSPSISTES